ncbi:hypothetical protein ABIB73_005142 [Bradyrhizobium sp. F1.4.3]|uniref:DUF3800 domain-containing protein n=1 Tax=Bradyrhizobium sp. F1.4.3 TaxID=3156356 RepID=UPI003394E084
MIRAADSVFLPVFRSIGGRDRVAVLINAFFDESSEGDAHNGLLTVSGYALDLAGVGRLTAEWQTLLDDYRLPYFHMAECNACDGIFEHLDNTECDNCAREAISIARAHPLHAHSFVLDQPQYREILQDQGFDCDPYSFMVFSAFLHVNKWVHENQPTRRISLFFESGYRTQKRATEVLQYVTKDNLRGKNRVDSYTFVRKEASYPTQAADLIAWHIRKGYENLRYGKPVRKDTKALLEDRTVLTIEFNESRLEEIRDNFCRKSGNLSNAAKVLFSDDDVLLG